MKRFTFLIIILLLTVGCSQKDVVSFDENSTLVIEKQVSSESVDYEVINEIKDKETVQKVIDLLKGVKWDKNIEVQMEREPDYKLDKTYHIWITPQGNTLELINTNNSYYIRLAQSDSSDLYKLMTGEELESN